MTSRAWTFGFALLLAWPAASQAGIVVLKSGDVFVGRIRAEEDTEEHLTIRWPYLDRTDRGQMQIEKFRVRWYSRDHDEPSDEYWEKYENETIDSRWIPYLERWRIRKKSEQEFLQYNPLSFEEERSGKLSPIPVTTRWFEVGKPDGWSVRTDGEITVFEEDKVGAQGYRARIHVFSVDAVKDATAEEQVGWVEAQLKRVGQGPDGYEVREVKRPHVVRGGLDQEMLTATKRGERTVVCLRRMSFRDERTYFFSAYCSEQDLSRLKGLMRLSLESLVILEDAKKKEPAAPTPGGGS